MDYTEALMFNMAFNTGNTFGTLSTQEEKENTMCAKCDVKSTAATPVVAASAINVAAPDVRVYNETAAPYDAVKATREVLTSRLNTSKWAKETALRVQFNMDDLPRPTTNKEFAEMLAKGFVTLANPDSIELVKWYDWSTERPYNQYDGLRFRDPSKIKDEVAYEAADKVLNIAVTAVKSKIFVLEPKEALAAVEAFETATF